MNNPFKIYFTFDTLHYIYITLYSTIFFFYFSETPNMIFARRK